VGFPIPICDGVFAFPRDGLGGRLVRRNVDGDGDLVLVDFAGGATDGWVDWKVMESLAGDLMASPKIEKFMLEKGKGSERK
jgi:hypothetical protein